MLFLKNNMPKVSIIIPTYNSNLFIKRTILSVQNQTFADWELLIIDDCSTDNTVELVNEFVKKDTRIKLFKTAENSGGPAHPKNIGFENSDGEFIAYLDHDDEWLPSKLEKQLEIFKNSKKENLGLVSCGAFLINESGKCFSIFKPIQKENLFPEILLSNPIYSNSGVLIKREVIETVGNRDEKMKYSEDWDMWIRISKSPYCIQYISEPLFNYYFHTENVTKTITTLDKVKDAEYVLDKHQNLYLQYEYIHIGYFRLGVMYFLGRNSKKSRECFTRSIKRRKMFLPSYFGYIFSFLGNLGRTIIQFLIFIYRILHGRKYLFHQF